MAMYLNHLKGFLTTLSYVVAVLAMGTLVTLLLTALGGQAQPETWRLDGGIKVLTDIKYAEIDGAVLRVNAVLPEESAAKPYPMVVYFHGGAWRTGNRRSGMRYLLPLARAGYACFSADYRLTSQARFPAQIHDCKAAVRWVREHAAEFNGDPDRIAVMGSSAGAHLALLLGLSHGDAQLEGTVGDCLDASSAVDLIVNWFGPCDLRSPDEMLDSWEQLIMTELLGALPSQVPDLAALASPVVFIDAADPPVLTIHGTADNTVPVEVSRLLDTQLGNAGIESEYIEVEGGGHGNFRFTSPNQDELIEMMIQFIDQHLKPAQPD
jgi:acetyl esterase/lipase